MTTLIAAALVFLAIHFIVSGTRLRDGITGVIGEQSYLGLFSLASLAAIAWLVIGYNHAQAGNDPLLYDLGPGIRHLGIPVIAIAFFLGVQGLLSSNPTRVQVGQPVAAPADAIQGVVRITRHPFLWSVVIWSAFHLAANGDEASVIFFGTFFLLALFGTTLIDAKRQRKMGAAWKAFASRTSNIPFTAVLARRITLNLSEDFGWRFLVAMVLFLVVLFTHYHLFGVSPFPGGWVPF